MDFGTREGDVFGFLRKGRTVLTVCFASSVGEERNKMDKEKSPSFQQRFKILPCKVDFFSVSLT